MSAFAAILMRELRLTWRQGGDAAMALGFFVIVAALFPFALGPEAALLRRAAGGILWVSALLAALLSLDRLFQADAADGTIDLLLLAPPPLELTVLAKAAAHWLTTGLPMVAAAPLAGLLLGLPPAVWPVLAGGLLLGTPVLSLLGGLGAALVLGARRAGILAALLLLPLCVPVLIFGAASVEAAAAGRDATPHLLLLGALLLLALPLCPWAAAAALRQSRD